MLLVERTIAILQIYSEIFLCLSTCAADPFLLPPLLCLEIVHLCHDAHLKCFLSCIRDIACRPYLETNEAYHFPSINEIEIQADLSKNIL